METKKLIDEFLLGDFARKNLFTHLQTGFPMPISYNNGIAIRTFFHKLDCNKDQIILSEPRFEIVLSYPSGRIIYFSEVDGKKYSTDEVVITRKQTEIMEYTFKQLYSACDEVIDFYNEYQKVTDIVYQKYYKQLEKYSKEIGMFVWYGGLYDSNGSI